MALRELNAGRKQSHWIWYIFPQLKGLGRSATADRYGLSGIREARAYLAHPILAQRMRDAISAMLAHRSKNAAFILGEIDALKLKSSLTLFSLADPSELIFTEALECFFGSERDARTLDLLNVQGRS